MKKTWLWLAVCGVAAVGALGVWMGCGKNRHAPAGAEAAAARLQAAGWNVRSLGGVPGRRCWLASRGELGDAPLSCHPARIRSAPEWRGLAMVKEDNLAGMTDVTDMEDCAWRPGAWVVHAAPETLAEVERALRREK